MQVSTYEQQPSKSITLPKGQLTEKKIFFTSSQCKRHLNGKLSSRYLPSGFKSKVLQHSQERESDVFYTSCSQRNARDIGNFKQGYRKQKKIQTIDWATKPGGQSLMDLDNTSHKCSGYQMRMENRRQPHATVESKKKKIQTEKDMLRNHHHDTDRILSNIWYIVLWREMKKQAKKIADSKADADSSSYKAMSDEKQMIFHKSPKKSIKTHLTKRPSNSTRNKHEENFESEENLIFASSEDVKILSWDTVSYSKKVPATYVLSNLSSPKQLKDTAAEKRPFDSLGTRRPSDSTGNNLEKLFVSKENLAFQSSKGVKVNNESQKRYVSHKFESSFQETMNQEFVYKYPPTPPVSSNASIPNQYSLAHLKFLVGIITASEKTGEKPVEIAVTSVSRLYAFLQTLRRTGVAKPNNVDSAMRYLRYFPDTQILTEIGVSEQDRNVTEGHQKENQEEVEENLQENAEPLVISQNLDMHSTKDQKQDEGREATRLMLEQILSVLSDDWRHKSTEASEDSADRPIHHTDISSDDNHTTFNSQEEDNTGMPGCMINETTTDTSSNESLSTVKSTNVRLYSDVTRNETSRMMSSIDKVMSEAEQLFGLERSQIFFDLLAAELCQFGSAGAISEFVPNMTESTVRQNVVSFFEQSWETMNRQMELLLRCPNSTILQQLPVQNFLSLMESVIKSSLNTTTKRNKNYL